MSGYSQKATKGIMWMFSGAASRQVVTITVNVVLARLLVPEDFGAVAIVVSLISILQVFAEMGISVAIVQRKEITRSLIDSGFIATAVVTATVVAALWVTAPWIAEFYSIDLLTKLFRIAAISYIAQGMFSLYRCLLLRDLKYREIAILQFVIIGVQGVVAVSLALGGFGAVSIVWGRVAGCTCVLVPAVWLTRYFPQSFGKFRDMRDLIAFGVWVSLGRIMGSASDKVDAFIIGKILNAASLGLYHMARTIVMLIPATYTGIIDQVTLPIYSKCQEQIDRARDGYWKVLSHTSIIMMPPICLLFIFASDVVYFVLGPKWMAAVPLIRIMSLFGFVQALGGGIFASLVYALKKPQLATVMNVFRLITLPSCLIVGGRWGLTGIACGFAIYGIVGRLFNQILLRRYVGLSFTRYVKEIFPAIASAVIVSAGIAALKLYVDSLSFGYVRLLLADFLCAALWFACYYAAVRCFAPEQTKRVMREFASALGRFRPAST